MLAFRFAAPMHVLHVLPEVHVEGGMGTEVFVTEAPEARTLRLMDARDRLRHRITSDVRPPVSTTTEVIFGEPAQTLVNYAADNQFDLIVMGTHGRTGMAHLMVGSVAERVVQAAACPVMTVRSGWYDVKSVVPATDLVAALA